MDISSLRGALHVTTYRSYVRPSRFFWLFNAQPWSETDINQVDARFNKEKWIASNPKLMLEQMRSTWSRPAQV